MTITADPASGGASLDPPSPNAMPPGTRIGDFEVISIIGEGGFGIVYEAMDHTLRRLVALKEYMPISLAKRRDDQSIVLRSERCEPTFAAGLKSFVNEARLLAQFDHPALVKVFRFWEQNGTAYMVMPRYEGRTLRDVLRENPRPDEDWLKAMLAPLLDALEILHTVRCYHRDIAPDNIMVLNSGSPLLLDFGAARRIISDMTQAVTVILKPGYAPIEQYADDVTLKQGPWTDIYALAAVLRLAITGKAAATSVTRIVSDPVRPLADTVTGYSRDFLQAIDFGLAVRPEDRPQSIADFRHALGIRTQAPSTQRLVRSLLPSGAGGPPPVEPAPALRSESPPFANLPPDPVRTTPRTIGGPSEPGLALPPESVADARLSEGTSQRPEPAKVAREPASGSFRAPAATSAPSFKAVLLVVGGALIAVIVAIVSVYVATQAPVSYPPSEPVAKLAPAPTRVETPRRPAAVNEPAPPKIEPRLPEPLAASPTTAAPATAPATAIPATTASPTPALPATTRPSTTPATTASPTTALPTTNDQTASGPKAGAEAVATTPLPTPVPVVPTGRVMLDIKPWGEVLVDGKARGLSPPLKSIILREGKYRFEIRNPASASITREIEIRGGSKLSIAHTFN